MRKIDKTNEPKSLKNYKKKNPNGSYDNLVWNIRQDIRQSCLIEQCYLCAYCCKEITSENSMNEHIQPRHHFPNLSLDFNNIVASCTTKGQCDNAKESREIPLTPLMEECETELEFRYNGQVDGTTKKAKDTIEILKLNDDKLCNARKQIIDDLLLIIGLNNPIDLEDNDLLESIITDLNKPDDENKMLPFSPILINIIKHHLKI